jgi:hypothetical protein
MRSQFPGPEAPYTKPSKANTLKTVITKVMINATRNILTEASIDWRVMHGLVATCPFQAKREMGP